MRYWLNSNAQSLPRFKKALLTPGGLCLVAGVLLVIFCLWWFVAGRQYPKRDFTHKNIITTVFWVGETENESNGFIANIASAWDANWLQSYGGVDSPDNRRGYVPAGFTPKENPFYFALPYDDIAEDGSYKPSAAWCQALSANPAKGHSWCKNAWIAIRSSGKIVYAQWEDVGPFEENDTAYVFGTNRPRNTEGERAGLDVSPAVRDYLGLSDVARTDWGFVRFDDVPDGPWKTTVTTSRGYRVN